MAETTNIEWADSTANFWIGCTKDGAGCVNCYAEADWDKRKHRVEWGPRGERSYCAAGWTLIPKLGRPAMANGGIDPALGRRRRIFVNSLADSFDGHPSIVWRDDMFGLLVRWPCMDMLLLTKRVENVAAMAPRDWTHDLGQWPEHIWLGCSVPSQAEVAKDIPELVRLKLTHRIKRIFLSIEPLVERVHISDALMRHIDWVIVGGESGKHARPMHPDWVRELRDQCARLGIPFLFKQWGEWVNEEQSPVDAVFPGEGRYPFGEKGGYWARLGKKTSGRLLDGVRHDGVPG